jgi:ligand-binding sensor domain-containing protein/signal transduction histidine kinase
LKKALLFCWLQMLAAVVICQQPASYFYSRIGKVNGLAADAAYCVEQDKEGYLWIGTENGLQRYDGVRFVTFRHLVNDASSLSANSVESMYYDSKGRLWLRLGATNLGYFNTQTFKFTPVKLIVPSSVRNNGALRFKEASDGRISIRVLQYGLVTFNPQLNEFSVEHNLVQRKNYIPEDIVEDGKSGKYWVTGKNGVELFDSYTMRFISADSNQVLKKLNQIIRENNAYGPIDPERDGQGRLWTHIWINKEHVGGPDVYCFDPKLNTWTSYKQSIDKSSPGYHVIDGILKQRSGDIWVYGTSAFAKLNASKNEFENVLNESLRLHGIDVETIFRLYEDKEQNIWIASTNGLYFFNPGNHIFNHIANVRNDDVRYTNSTVAILQTRKGNIYSAAWGAGIFVYDSNFNVVHNPIIPEAKNNKSISFWDIHERANGELWLGMQGGFLLIYNQQTGKQVEMLLPVFEKHTIRQVIEDSLGNMWMGTQSGLVIKCIQSNWKDTAHSFKLITRLKGHVVKMVADSKGFVWVCNDKDGLVKIKASDGSIVKHYNELLPEGKRLQSIGSSDILEFNDSIMLIASNGINLLNTRTEAISFLTTDDGLPSANAVSLIKDRQGYIWVGMLNGICRLWVGENFINTFGLEDGVNNNHFQPNAVTMLHDGRIAFGNSTGVMVFDPKKVYVSRKAVPVYISGFKVFDKVLRVDSLLKLKKITLPYTDNSITIDATTHTFTQTYGILYKLESVDKDWKMANNRQILYNYLAPGVYIFKTKVTRAERNEPDLVTELVIEIVPPVWNQWWFYALIILIVAGIFYLADRERLARIRATEKLRTDIALNLHHDVNVALNNINLMSEMARMKADKDIGKSKALIEQISGKSNKMIIAMDDMLWSIDPANDTMEKTMLRMTEFADSLRMRHEAEIIIRIDKKVSKLKLDMKLRHGFFLIFKEALRAIVQYSGGKQTLVNIDLNKNHLYLKMHDEAVLDLADENVSKAIEEVKNYAAEINAEVDIQYDKNGSDFVLMVNNV